MEWYREGRVPLHTLRADVDYGTREAITTYGIIGVKVWIFKGEILEHDPMAQDKRSLETGESRERRDRDDRGPRGPREDRPTGRPSASWPPSAAWRRGRQLGFGGITHHDAAEKNQVPQAPLRAGLKGTPRAAALSTSASSA
jgi:hypothetical protein